MPFNRDLTTRAQVGAMNASSIAAAGIASAVQRFDASASRTAARPLDDLAGESVERMQAKTAAQANAVVLRAADEMTGTLLDILV